MKNIGTILRNAGYCCLLLGLSASAGCRSKTTDKPVQMPRLSMPWTEAVRILGDSVPGKTFYSDFLLIRDRETPARWHAIGIHKAGNTLYHAVSRSLTEGWELLPEITAEPADRMWAPFAVWSPDSTRAYLYYHHGLGLDTTRMCNSMRVLSAPGPGLNDWSSCDIYGEQPDMPGIRNIAFRGDVPRDACIFFDDSLNRYVMYYADNTPRAVLARTSQDAAHWSEPVVVMTTPSPRAAFCSPESPFVLRRDGLYYLFVSGFDYGRVALYVSENPFDFGDPEANKIGELSGHAPEIVIQDGKHYIACAHISSVPGKAPGKADLWGTYIQELQWEPADSAAYAKIVRRNP